MCMPGQYNQKKLKCVIPVEVRGHHCLGEGGTWLGRGWTQKGLWGSVLFLDLGSGYRGVHLAVIYESHTFVLHDFLFLRCILFLNSFYFGVCTCVLFDNKVM